VTPAGLVLKERAPDVTIDEILQATEAELHVEDVCEMPV
jgi:acyl CoA:acetate/3-ketoacid CoA transferase beta subunit